MTDLHFPVLRLATTSKLTLISNKREQNFPDKKVTSSALILKTWLTFRNTAVTPLYQPNELLIVTVLVISTIELHDSSVIISCPRRNPNKISMLMRCYIFHTPYDFNIRFKYLSNVLIISWGNTKSEVSPILKENWNYCLHGADEIHCGDDMLI